MLLMAWLLVTVPSVAAGGSATVAYAESPAWEATCEGRIWKIDVNTLIKMQRSSNAQPHAGLLGDGFGCLNVN